MKEIVRKKATFQNTSTGGFTLVEMIVAVFIFTVVMLIAVGALLSVLNANRRAQATKVVMNNINIALESMTREIRMGRGYQVLAGNSGFKFTDKDGCVITYGIARGVDNKKSIVRTLENTTSSLFGSCKKAPSVDVPMTASDVNISTLGFYSRGTGTNDSIQPAVLILIRGVAGETERTRVPFDVQTFVVQRSLERD